MYLARSSSARLQHFSEATMRTRIESDGVRTRIYDVETGREIRGATAVSWSHTAETEVAQAALQLAMPHMQATCDAHFVCADPNDPRGLFKRVKRIEFEDGSVFEPG
ncbi:hypothetical protein [Methylobacterium terrae]|nr:hypothetical protein [Methylobacterium terrae]